MPQGIPYTGFEVEIVSNIADTNGVKLDWADNTFKKALKKGIIEITEGMDLSMSFATNLPLDNEVTVSGSGNAFDWLMKSNDDDNKIYTPNISLAKVDELWDTETIWFGCYTKPEFTSGNVDMGTCGGPWTWKNRF